MTNPFTTTLKKDHQEASLQALPYPIFFTLIMYIVNRDSMTALLFIFIYTFFYVFTFLTTVREQQKLFTMVPATSGQFVQAIYVQTLKFLLLVMVMYTPVYAIAVLLDDEKISIAEHIAIYVAVFCVSNILCAVMIWLQFKIEQRSYLGLAQLTSAPLIALTGFSFVTLIEKTGMPHALQALLLFVVTCSVIYVFYKLTLQAYRNFNLFS